MVVLVSPRASDWWAVEGRGAVSALLSLESTVRPFPGGVVQASYEGSFRRSWANTDVRFVLESHAQVLAGEEVVVYATPTGGEDLVSGAGGRMVGIQGRLKDLVDSRSATRAALGAREVATVPFVLLSSGVSYGTLSRHLGPRMVVQADRGSGGKQTMIVEDEAAFAAARSRLRGVLVVSPFRSDLIVNAHVLVTGDETRAVSLSIQLVGIPTLGGGACEYAGSDFASVDAVLGAARRSALWAQVSGVAEWLAAIGYMGVAGVDLVEDGNFGFEVLEVNPRFQASSGLLALRQVLAGEVDIIQSHAQCWGVELGPPGGLLRQQFGDVPPAGQLVLHASVDCVVVENSKQIGETSGGTILLPSLDGWCSGAIATAFDAPPVGARVTVGAPLLRAYTAQGICGGDSRRLNSFGEDVAALMVEHVLTMPTGEDGPS